MTDRTLRELSGGGLTALTELDLRGCMGVTDAGLGHLASLAALTTLWLSRPRNATNTTRAGRKALQAALPALRIRRRWYVSAWYV